MKRLLVSSGVPKPANWRIVQSRPRYIVGCDAAGEGVLPGQAQMLAAPRALRSAAVSRSGMGTPESVVNCARRSGAFESVCATCPARHAFSSFSSRWT